MLFLCFTKVAGVSGLVSESAGFSFEGIDWRIMLSSMCLLRKWKRMSMCFAFGDTCGLFARFIQASLSSLIIVGFVMLILISLRKVLRNRISLV